ncbi:unnamed protein product [Pneumocystis jirovecii]|uniref:Plectin/eS10 N-terminal domain-containing protein n=2 Tax=Pneumocystis jirovecii TaxID=42068 RepID=L0PD00_PNEJI|nr:uncharacterized protein T551_03635 [Pneumocystis jirovecii RU7]KTW26063.1 hypothetical protein T551_03635 [Pneumocystis jirovecii RU7]CCJ30107.1 unnamed protein product [Pneumocystis jirovecii]
MIIPKNNRKKIYELLFKDGTLVAKKDFNAPSSVELQSVPNLQVIKACQSLTSRGYLKTQFSWQYYYYTLTNEGIDYLREWLHLPNEAIPNICKRHPRQQITRMPRIDSHRLRNDKYDYRRRDYSEKKEGNTAPGDFIPTFRSGTERGYIAA